MKAIIIAAGSAKRLGDQTRELPKGLLDINGKSILERQIDLLKNNGKIAVDYYCKSWKSFFLPKYWLRHFTKYLPKPLVLNILKYLIPIVYPIGWLIGKLPYGYLFKRAIPVADPIYYYEREYGKTDISYKKRLEWSLLDTFDWLTPAYDNPQTEFTINEWMERANLKNIEVLKAGHMVARGNK